MEIDQIERTLIEVLMKLQEMGGRPRVEIEADTRPVGDLPEFDSLNGLEVAIELGAELGRELSGNLLFVDESGSGLNVHELAVSAHAMLQEGATANG